MHTLLPTFYHSRSIHHFFGWIFVLFFLPGCQSDKISGVYDFTLFFDEENTTTGRMLVVPSDSNGYEVTFHAFGFTTLVVEKVNLTGNILTGSVRLWRDTFAIEGEFSSAAFEGQMQSEKDQFKLLGTRLSKQAVAWKEPDINYLLADRDLEEVEQNVDHAGIISDWDNKAFARGKRIYNDNCINCHGNRAVEGSIPLANKFWEQSQKAGSDPFSMYQTLTKGVGSMPPQMILTPREKYDVILYIQEAFFRNDNVELYTPPSPGYLAGLPKGDSKGPATKPYHPWSDMDYGNFFINTYELVDEKTGPERFHSPGPVPFADEDYSQNNFAYKGIALRLDEGPGGVSKGKAWMIFDHDVMRVAGGWTGKGFIDWDGILLNDRHETYPRTIGTLHFETPVGPGWANPKTGSFEDPRWRARDNRPFGPLPKSWADYKGIYHHENHIILSYKVGNATVLEELGVVYTDSIPVFTRTLNISPSNAILKMRIAPEANAVTLIGEGAALSKENGFHVLQVKKKEKAIVKVFIGPSTLNAIEVIAEKSSRPEDLSKYTKPGPAHYAEEMHVPITPGNEENAFAKDILHPPFENPWNSRMKLSGLDFMSDPNIAIACTTDGDIWKITGLTPNQGFLIWKRIGAGLFQPLGLKILDDKIYVICRDQIVRLQDYNGDDAIDFYESFNHDHQVTDHFHEFAMGLQADKAGNLYYAKSGRHAREALIPQHGTLLKVSADGSKTDIVATGFRAANGVCINPDGSFIVTDQQGYWNPMNRINWVEVDGPAKFYGNMWGYNPPPDTSRTAMEPPMVWVDMDFDRSPSELLWVDSEEWGPLKGSLLSFSYGYGKIQLVLQEKVGGQRQGGVIDLPGIKFLTGVMRGRFNPGDGHLYACGMSAWGTSQLMKGGGLYRIRYTGKPLTVPIGLQVMDSGIKLQFSTELDENSATNLANYQMESWNLVRSSKYGSDRYNTKNWTLLSAELLPGNTTIYLQVEGIQPVDVMTISYDLIDKEGNSLKGTLQNTIHTLGKDTQLSYQEK